MRYELKVSAFDVMDQVHYAVIAQSQEELQAEGSTWLTICAGQIRGTGENDLREWCRDALIAALESI